MAKTQKVAFIDYWRLAGAFHRGDIVSRIDLSTGRVNNIYGLVTAVLRATGHLDVEWPWGNERVSADELSRINPREMEFLPTYIDTSYSGWDIAKSRNDDATEYHYNYALPRIAADRKTKLQLKKDLEAELKELDPKKVTEHTKKLIKDRIKEIDTELLGKGSVSAERVAVGSMAACLADTYQKISNHLLYAATVKRWNRLSELQAYEALNTRYPTVSDEQIKLAVGQVYSLVWVKFAGSDPSVEKLKALLDYEVEEHGHLPSVEEEKAEKFAAAIKGSKPGKLVYEMDGSSVTGGDQHRLILWNNKHDEILHASVHPSKQDAFEYARKHFPKQFSQLRNASHLPKPNNDTEQIVQNMLGTEFLPNDIYNALQITAPMRGEQWWTRDTANDAYLDYRIPNFDQYKYAKEAVRLAMLKASDADLTFAVCAGEKSPKHVVELDTFSDPYKAVEAAAKALDKNVYACVNIMAGTEQVGHIDIWDSHNKDFAVKQLEKAIKQAQSKMAAGKVNFTFAVSLGKGKNPIKKLDDFDTADMAVEAAAKALKTHDYARIDLIELPSLQEIVSTNLWEPYPANKRHALEKLVNAAKVHQKMYHGA